MNRLKFLLAAFAITVLTLGIYSCAKEEKQSNENQLTTDVRTAEIDPVLTENEMVKFNSLEHFQSTISQLENASISDRENWLNSLPINTAMKEFDAFLNQVEILGENATITQINQVEQSNLGKYQTVIFDEYGKFYQPKFKVFSEFTNVNGYFKIGTSVIKVTETKVFTITKPELISDLNTITDATPTNIEIGVLPVDILETRSLTCSCPNPSSGEFKINFGTFGRRFLMNHSAIIGGVSVVTPGGSIKTSFIVTLSANSKHQQKKFVGWWDQAINSTHTFRANGTFQGISPSTQIGTWNLPTVTQVLTDKVNNNISRSSNLIGSFPFSSSPAAEICIESARQRVDRTGTTNYFGLLQCN
jgi:hypothetical protein